MMINLCVNLTDHLSPNIHLPFIHSLNTANTGTSCGCEIFFGDHWAWVGGASETRGAELWRPGALSTSITGRVQHIAVCSLRYMGRWEKRRGAHNLVMESQKREMEAVK